MQYLIFGIVALALGLLALQAFSQANPSLLARRLRVVGGGAVLAGAAGLALRGYLSYAFPLAMLGSWLIWGTGSGPWSGQPSGTARAGRTSQVRTEHLVMTLDHDSGAMSGQVLKGLFAGRDIDTLKPAELALLWQDCRFNDPQSAQLLEAYLDRIHPTWRDDVARGEAEMSSGADGRMSAAEAYEILGLKPGADSDAIRRAHRELMLKLHPDRGGSTYLAAKINEAKDVLLGE